MAVAWIIVGVVALVIILVIALYNALVRLKNQIDNSWAQIDVQLKRRNDLIPNLVETVKGYAKHEKELFTEVTKARANMLQAGSLAEKAKASNQITDALKSIFAVAESYPQLKANENFLQLQEELSGTEGKIAYARQHFNDMVMLFNTKIELFPNNIFANMLNFKSRELFKATEAERKEVKVKF